MVANGRAVTIFQDAGKEAAVCWDAVTGQERWRHAYDCAYKNSYGNGPRSTPSIDGSRVYTIGATGIVTFVSAPAAAAALTWTGSFYYRCRFDADTMPFKLFMQKLWSTQQMRLKSIKL